MMGQEQLSGNSEPQVDQQLPEYASIDGETVKLKGLDYNLLKQQSGNKNEELISQIKNKINIISGNVLARNTAQNNQQKTNRIINHDDKKLYHKFHNIFENNAKSNTNKNSKYKPSIQARKDSNQNKIVYYQFDLDPQFGNKKPRVVEKRLGRVEIKEVYTHFDQTFVEEFTRLTKIPEKFSMMNLQNNGGQSDMFAGEQSDSDDIFDNKQKPQANIEIGKKLDFGLKKDDEDDFMGLYNQPATRVKQAEIQEQRGYNKQQENDKYFFMRKKIKKATLNDQDVDGYDQCYYNNGPSLQQLADMKKQGIEYFGDEFEFKQKEKKKPNIGRDYEKIQKIIQEKNKK